MRPAPSQVGQRPPAVLKEKRDAAPYNTWVADPILKIISDFETSLKKYPPIKLGTPDPYTPAQ